LASSSLGLGIVLLRSAAALGFQHALQIDAIVQTFVR
jgi:hypothetical protein